eukprot:749178-Amphidinium_carterae.3
MGKKAKVELPASGAVGKKVTDNAAAAAKKIAQPRQSDQDVTKAVKKILHDSLPDLTDEEVFSLKRGDPPMTCWQRLVLDKKRWIKNEITMGA